MATKKKATLEAQLLSWGSAAGLAALAFVLLVMMGDWGVIQAIWGAGMIFLLLGAFNYFIFARPTPPLAGSFPPDMATAGPRKTPEAVKRGPAEQPAPTAPESSEPPAAAMAEAPRATDSGPAEPEKKPAQQQAKPAAEGDKKT